MQKTQEKEFKTQVFSTPQQWDSGLSFRLESVQGRGFTLHPAPKFSRWIDPLGINNPIGLAIDECGHLFFVDADSCRLYRYDPNLSILEKIITLEECGAEEILQSSLRLALGKHHFWLMDIINHRIQVYSRDQFQLIYMLDAVAEPVDFTVDDAANVYVLEKSTKQVFKYDFEGRLVANFGSSELKQPFGLAMGNENLLYILDEEYPGFVTFTDKGDFVNVIGQFDDDFSPTHIVIDDKGNIFVWDSYSVALYQFDADGSYIASATIAGYTGSIFGLAVDSSGVVYVITERGIALFSSSMIFTNEEGVYYSKTLDSGISECQWHRLVLDAHIPPKCTLSIRFHSSDDPAVKQEVDDIINDTEKNIQQKVEALEGTIPWSVPDINPKDMLFREKAGRYLWLKLAFSTLDENATPVLNKMKVYYPRTSYLRYLPAIYQEDPVSKEFLQRFLSLFESVFYDLESDISGVFKYFDAQTVPQNFLKWLARWLNIALEDAWPEESKRQLITQAHEIFQLKGTASGLSQIIKIYAGKEPIILDASTIGKPMVLNHNFKLGDNSLLVGTPIRGFRLGDDSILGRTAIRDDALSIIDPFLQTAHRFTVIINLTQQEYSRLEVGIRRIINEEKPAHTNYTLRNADEIRVGMNSYVGADTKIGGYRPIQIAVNSVLGGGLVAYDAQTEVGKVERHSLAGVDTHLY